MLRHSPGLIWLQQTHSLFLSWLIQQNSVHHISTRRGNRLGRVRRSPHCQRKIELTMRPWLYRLSFFFIFLSALDFFLKTKKINKELNPPPGMALICCPCKERLRRLLLKHWDKCSLDSSGWPSGPLGLLGSSSLMGETPESREKTEGNASFAFVSLLHLDAQANMRERMGKKRRNKKERNKKNKPIRLPEVVTSYVLLLKLCWVQKTKQKA